MNQDIYSLFTQLSQRPEPFSIYTVLDLWTDPYLAKQMLGFHLNPEVDISSRKHRFIDRSVQWIVDFFELGKRAKMVDFGCGPGLYCQRYASRGLQVTGIDFSGNSIAYATRQAMEASLQIEYRNENYLDVELIAETYDFAQMIMCDFCALGPDKRKALLRKMYEALKPGGHVLFDVYSTTAFGKKGEETTVTQHEDGEFWSSEASVELRQSFKYEAAKVSLDRYCIVQPGHIRLFYNWLQYFHPDDLRMELKGSGFELQYLFGSVAGDPYDPCSDEFAVGLRKI